MRNTNNEKNTHLFDDAAQTDFTGQVMERDPLPGKPAYKGKSIFFAEVTSQRRKSTFATKTPLPDETPVRSFSDR